MLKTLLEIWRDLSVAAKLYIVAAALIVFPVFITEGLLLASVFLGAFCLFGSFFVFVGRG